MVSLLSRAHVLNESFRGHKFYTGSYAIFSRGRGSGEQS